MRSVLTKPRSELFLAVALSGACQSDYGVLALPVDVDPGLVTECDFSPVSGTKFSRYDCNPVFSSTGEDWAPYINAVGFRAEYVLGHPFYQMWYVGSQEEGGADWGIGYAVSDNGTEWTPHPNNPVYETGYDYDKDGAAGLSIVWDANDAEYLMSYQAIQETRNGLRLSNAVATSADGVDWDQRETPTMELSEPSDAGISWCWSVATAYIDNDILGFMAGDPTPRDANQVCRLYGVRVPSPDNWQPGSTPILPDETTTYDKLGVIRASVVEHDGLFYMFYVGFSRWDPLGAGAQTVGDMHLALATSQDGITWTRHPDNPLDQLSNFPEDGRLQGIHAQSVGSRILVWLSDEYEDVGNAVGYFYYEPDITPHE